MDTITVKLDLGATRHYFKDEHKSILTDLKLFRNGPVAQLPDNSYVKATYEGLLQLHSTLLVEAQKVLVYPGVTNKSLLSVSQSTQNNCEIFFNNSKTIITKNNDVILTGTKNPIDKLYDIKIPTLQKINFIIRKDKTKTELAQFYHATACSLSISTFQKVIYKGNFIRRPGIDNLNFEKIIGTTLGTEQGHLDQE